MLPLSTKCDQRIGEKRTFSLLPDLRYVIRVNFSATFEAYLFWNNKYLINVVQIYVHQIIMVMVREVTYTSEWDQNYHK